MLACTKQRGVARHVTTCAWPASFGPLPDCLVLCCHPVRAGKRVQGLVDSVTKRSKFRCSFLSAGPLRSPHLHQCCAVAEPCRSAPAGVAPPPGAVRSYGQDGSCCRALCMLSCPPCHPPLLPQLSGARWPCGAARRAAGSCCQQRRRQRDDERERPGYGQRNGNRRARAAATLGEPPGTSWRMQPMGLLVCGT